MSRQDSELFGVFNLLVITLLSGDRLQPAFECAVATYPADGQTLAALYQSAIAGL
ncbi:MAG: hypothetical protein AAFX78_13730 [Cyanobacteria bacterium J06638_20]